MRDNIERLLAHYADAVCRRDAEAWGATWTPDGVWDLGHTQLTGRDAMVPAWTDIMSNFDAVIHQYADGWADLDKDSGTGTGRWYVNEWIKPAGADPFAMFGFYDDTYAVVDGSWLFASRQLTPIYRGATDFSGDFMGFGKPAAG